ncbi:hypothetical protein JL107_09140 [Nakamurella flavida]|uniref:Uncharacterized protein n=1 Tax=Nakamurella flavida TaxID=363630 RepID=A0A938YPI2_9ACTN|nr:hypothetical protein [Nakamurella flavida]MBM9476605.1 hypothetical protein [Nakamurella flavida]MDP9778957.1 hypothetical protein [Nakamurella flavida]
MDSDGNDAPRGRLILCDIDGGPADGTQVRLTPDPDAPTLPAPTVTILIDDRNDCPTPVLQYRRCELSPDTHRWVYRLAG